MPDRCEPPTIDARLVLAAELIKHDGALVAAQAMVRAANVPHIALAILGVAFHAVLEWIEPERRREITYILTGGRLGIEPGYVVMGLKRA